MHRVLLATLTLGVVLGVAVNAVTTNHHHQANNNGFQPNNGFFRMNDQIAEPSGRVETTLERLDTPQEAANSLGGSVEQRTQRFGITAYGGNGIQGAYPSGGGVSGLYGPVKIDLGGVLLGSLLGLGAVLILPKLMHAFSSSYGGGGAGGYGRSVEADMSSFTAMLTKLDSTLDRYNVDSSSCVQRFTCSYVQSALDNMAVGNATDVDRFISSISENTLIVNMLDGTAIRQAVEAGKDVNTDCHSLYSRCQLDKQMVLKILTNILPV
ncbi:DM4/DM12 domain-containing protein Desiccate [Arctopsyche grandis]|uniref:DM4/DM12 domain-containing protein Desiccate n=1 Tax=Arctopsyche grandis TaxID=121162 RepID=UPI00406D91F7